MCSVSVVTVVFIHTMEDDQRLNTLVHEGDTLHFSIARRQFQHQWLSVLMCTCHVTVGQDSLIRVKQLMSHCGCGKAVTSLTYPMRRRYNYTTVRLHPLRHIMTRVTKIVRHHKYSGTPLRRHPSSLYNGHLLNPKIMYNKPLTRGHSLYYEQVLLVLIVSTLERFHCTCTESTLMLSC